MHQNLSPGPRTGVRCPLFRTNEGGDVTNKSLTQYKFVTRSQILNNGTVVVEKSGFYMHTHLDFYYTVGAGGRDTEEAATFKFDYVAMPSELKKGKFGPMTRPTSTGCARHRQNAQPTPFGPFGPRVIPAVANIHSVQRHTIKAGL